MINKFIKKTITSIFLILIIFNINKVEVNAANTCTWYTYQTYINNDGIYYTPMNNNEYGIYFINYDYANEMFPFRYGFSKTEKELNGTLWMFNNKFKNTIQDKKCEEYPYIAVLYLLDEPIIVPVDEKAYKDFLRNQYSKIVSKNTGLVGDSKDQNHRNYKNFYAIAKETEGLEAIVFTNKKTPYKTEVLNMLRSKLGEEEVEKFSTFGVDIGESSTRYELYNQLKDRWMPIARKALIESGYNFETKKFEAKKENCDISDDLGCIFIDFSSILPKERIFFRHWFNLVQRYILEDYGLDDYVEFYTYAYDGITAEDDEKVANLRELVYGNSEATETTDNSTDGGIIYANCMDEKLFKLQQNKCLQYCINTEKCNDNSLQVSECQKSKAYKDCRDYYDHCNLNCKNVGSSTAKDKCVEQCVKENMGEEGYNAFITSYNNKCDEISENANSAWEKAKTTLSKIKSPSLSGIDFGGYKANCDDVVFLHDMYVILRILAPVLVILMGTIDFAKSVVAGDEKKIVEARKKFPKRLILLILFILVPFIIEILLGTFSGAETSLMRCVIKGA